MGIRVGLEHRTAYRFERPITVYPHIFRLRPAPHARTPIEAYSLTIKPEGHYLNWQQDPFGNYLARVVFPEPVDHLDITVDLVADMQVVNPFDFFVEDSAENFPFEYEKDVATDLEPYLKPQAANEPMLDSWLKELDFLKPGDDGKPEPMQIVDFMVAINQAVYEEVGYSIRMEPGVQTPTETLTRGIGSCRDTGWLLVETLRRLGLAARFVSGYLIQLTPDPLPGLETSSVDGPTGPEADFTDLHAWAEVYIPGAGWVGLDPTSGLMAGEGHIPLACTPRPSAAAPVTGAIDETEVEFEYANIVRRVREEPRVTLPYTESQWDRIDALGRAVDTRIEQNDLRLTMGGEPTFVSVTDMEGAEWNIAADGPTKQRLALDLTRRLRDRFGPGGLIQHGQGKWYPGEPLPRWQIGALWRTDGKELWRRPELLAGSSTDEPTGESTDTDAKRFLEAVAQRFSLSSDRVIAAWEDPIYELRAEYRLPPGQPPAKLQASVKERFDQLDMAAIERLAAKEGRALVTGQSKSSRIDPRHFDPDRFQEELLAALGDSPGDPTGYALPLHPGPLPSTWLTTEWNFRRGRLYLTPGDSPIGLRLPLSSLTWSRYASTFTRSPFEERDELAMYEGEPAPAETVGLHEVPPGAITAQVQDGYVRVFLPPLERVEEAAELVAVLNKVAIDLDQPVVLEGYPLPTDHRVNRLLVTPDPGVIEVNVHPSGSWEQLSDVLPALYTEARMVGLGAEKFDLDGTHTGTGGGNHITLGGATPADSPLLRRPDLLASMVTYWQHHPALSYLFSGRFIGPTSQSPRVDEGRDDKLYELDIALAELQRLGSDAPPWSVDRLLRHLLTDLTGNTHRSEFSIDKLYSPDSDRGRLGILELRAMEMPPHPQMALVQALLVRSLVVRFAEDPYSGPAVRWGDELHDQFLLPWYAKLDAYDVLDDLANHDIDFDKGWLEPFLEFRFPLIGTVDHDDVSMEIREAIEPWHVLGEEATGSGTSRYVDSAVERVQVLVDGFNPQRHLVTCNGVPVPLQPTRSAGVGVAGVRYKAWDPVSSLHPTIGVQTPLTFDLIDRWNNRSLGGCTYHVSHPGGLAYDRLPINAAEAETRRLTRFENIGHTPGTVDVSQLEAKLASMFARSNRRTLDLRAHPEADSRARGR